MNPRGCVTYRVSKERNRVIGSRKEANQHYKWFELKQRQAMELVKLCWRQKMLIINEWIRSDPLLLLLLIAYLIPSLSLLKVCETHTLTHKLH